MNSEIQKAWIAVIGSVVVAIISAVVSIVTARRAARTSRELEAFKAEKAKEAAERDARRAYEYDARKRLYHEFEPLRFQLREAAEGAYCRILSLARSARNGDIGTAGGWLSREGYYLRSSVYRLLAPVALFKLMQRKLTLVDLAVDRKITTEYQLLKRLYVSWTDDFDFAAAAPKLNYNPHAELPESVTRNEPAVYVQQGIPAGYLDRSLEALLVSDKDGVPRMKTYGEFEVAFRDLNSELHKANVVLVNSLINFHPSTRPVLWRMMVAQACMYRALLTGDWPFSDDERKLLDWRQNEEEAPLRTVLGDPFDVAHAYVHRDHAA